MSAQSLEQYLSSGVVAVSPIVDFNKSTDTLYPFDLTKNNTQLTEELFSNTTAFSRWIEQTLLETGSRYGIGGYNEHRTIYNRTQHFNTEEEPRTLHLGIDIWGPAGTSVYAPLHGLVHSFNNNDAFGDYGATIILEHHYPFKFFTLFGHLSLNSIKDIFRGQPIKSGE
ncbi:MAG: peptidoglycan DD-metalloendopeptidase family protein, partial [Pyrinomonadaceae bacterium]|nr:peptidoglycan DD-metalloendopeptidase family protein [Sphingobacteriaceae bacterium]